MTPVWMHPSAGFEHQARLREEARRTNVIPPACHYVSAHQSELWRAVHEAHSPTSADKVTHSPLAPFFAFRERGFDVPIPIMAHQIALGCGGSYKDLDLTRHLVAHDLAPSRFTPQDVSSSLALLSAQSARSLDCLPKDFPIQPVVGDLFAMSDFGAWLDEQDREAPRIITAFGLLPNFEPTIFLPWLKQLLRPQDVLLLSANLAPVADKDDHPDKREPYITAVKQILPQYENDETRSWLLRVLHDWGWDDEVDLESYKMRPVQRGGLLCCEASVVWKGSGERLQLFRSYRYTPKRLKELLKVHDFQLGPSQIAGSREEGVWLVQLAQN